MVKVGDLNGSSGAKKWSFRMSEDHASLTADDENGTGGNYASRDPSISWDGKSVVFSTKAYNLLPDSLMRDDGKKVFLIQSMLPFSNSIFSRGIGEIEIEEMGIGYSAGNLRIEDLSGIGSGAQASYKVDNLGRIVSIEVLSAGTNYSLKDTVVSVEQPRGGSGFLAGTIRFPQGIGEGSMRTGGGKIYRIEMSNHGYGYKIGQDDSSDFSDLLILKVMVRTLMIMVFLMTRVHPEFVRTDSDGRVYIEQRFNVEVVSNNSDLLNTRLTIAGKDNYINPLVIEFSNNSGQGPNVIDINNKSTSDIRDEIINLIDSTLEVNSSLSLGDYPLTPIIDDNITGESTFTFAALSGRFDSNKISAIRVTAQSNMVISGSGYTTATPVINQVPAVFGFSEISSNPTMQRDSSLGRMAMLVERDEETDDIYLYSEDESNNSNIERISISSFGTPINYLSGTNDAEAGVPSLPSNRFPAISGNGRYVFYLRCFRQGGTWLSWQ